MITFAPFWVTIKKKKITQYDLIERYKMSRGTLDNIKHNRSITLNTLNDLCNMLNCDITDVISFTKDEEYE